MITVRFHKTLLPYTNGVREISIERDTYFHTVRNCLNLFPTLETVTKKLGVSNTQDLVLVVDKKIITYEELFFLPPDGVVIVLIPSFYGGDPITIAFAAFAFVTSTVISLSQGYDLGSALFRGIAAAGFTLLGFGLAGSLTANIIGQAALSAVV